MINQILYLLVVFIIAIVYLMLRFGFLRGLLVKGLSHEILAELDSLKVSAPNLKSTSDTSNSISK